MFPSKLQDIVVGSPLLLAINDSLHMVCQAYNLLSKHDLGSGEGMVPVVKKERKLNFLVYLSFLDNFLY